MLNGCEPHCDTSCTALEFAGALWVDSTAVGRGFLLTYLLVNKKSYTKNNRSNESFPNYDPFSVINTSRV